MKYTNKFKDEYHKDKISLYQGDCMELLKQTPDNHFDLAVCDVNYGIKEDGRKTAGRTFRKDGSARESIDKRTGRKAVIYNTYTSKGWDEKQPEQIYFNELFRVSKKHILFGENYLKFNQKNKSTGRIFWDKVNGDNDFSDGEMIWTNLFTSVRQIEFMWNGMLQGKSIKSGRINQGNKKLCEKRIHPTQKPVKLYDWLLHNYANKGNPLIQDFEILRAYRVLDTHLGSGSSAIAAHYFGCEFVGIELDKEYFDASVKRFKEQTMQQKLF